MLVDGFLVEGRLDPSALDLVFGYGVLLQLIDDFQDLEEDRRAGHSTPFVRAGAALEESANRLLNFIGRVAVLHTGNRSPAQLGQRLTIQPSGILSHAQ